MLPALAKEAMKNAKFPTLATIDGDQPRVRPVSPVRTDGFTVYVANLRMYHKTQEIAAKNFYRPRSKDIAAKYENVFTKANLFTIDERLGGWQAAQKKHFSDGGVFDQIYQPGK